MVNAGEPVRFSCSCRPGFIFCSLRGGEPKRGRQLQLNLTGSPAFTIHDKKRSAAENGRLNHIDTSPPPFHTHASQSCISGRTGVQGEDGMATVTAAQIGAAAPGAQ